MKERKLLIEMEEEGRKKKRGDAALKDTLHCVCVSFQWLLNEEEDA